MSESKSFHALFFILSLLLLFQLIHLAFTVEQPEKKYIFFCQFIFLFRRLHKIRQKNQ
jgi:hypothetical protein